jgi:hypothetical protein
VGFIPERVSDIAITTVISIGSVILTDYVSLFFVRRFPEFAQRYPICAALFSSVVGLVLVAIGMFIWTFIGLLAESPNMHDLEFVGFLPRGAIIKLLQLAPSVSAKYFGSHPLSSTMTSALIIHLWLPLFALSSLAVKLTFRIFRAVEKAQWFLKQGDAHPLKAIGIVATIIVFGSAMTVKEGWALLSVLERS